MGRAHDDGVGAGASKGKYEVASRYATTFGRGETAITGAGEHLKNGDVSRREL